MTCPIYLHEVAAKISSEYNLLNDKHLMMHESQQRVMSRSLSADLIWLDKLQVQ